MTDIEILRDLVAKSRLSLIATCRARCKKKNMDVSAALDEATQKAMPENILTPPEKMTETERTLKFLNEEYHEKYVWWHRHMKLLRSSEKNGWQ